MTFMLIEKIVLLDWKLFFFSFVLSEKIRTLIAKQGYQKYILNLLANNNSMYCPMSVAELPSIFLEQ